MEGEHPDLAQQKEEGDFHTVLESSPELEKAEVPVANAAPSAKIQLRQICFGIGVEEENNIGYYRGDFTTSKFIHVLQQEGNL